jgi:phosphomannomutase
MTEIISKYDKKLSELLKNYFKYFNIEETNFKVENKDKKLNQLKEKYSDGQQDELDGLTVEYDDWWFNVRPSNTEPFLRLNLEAKTEKLMKEKIQELAQLITA